MIRNIYINVSELITRIALMEDDRLSEVYIESEESQRLIGNVYLGRVTKVLPGIHAAFVDIGLKRDAFLYVHDIAPALAEESRELLNELEDEDSSFADTSETIAHHLKTPINQILQPGQKILVQITREPMDMKGARVTAHITLPGRYLVFMATVNHIGISKRIESETERNRLKGIIDAIRPSSSGIIIRTVAEGRDQKDFEEDIQYLESTWASIQESMKKMKPPALIHQDLDPISRVLRDLFDQSIQKVVIDSLKEYEHCRKLVESFAPNLIERIELYRGDEIPIFDKYNIEIEIEKALQRKVRLPSGGYLVFDQTEALVSVDVNTGRFVGQQDLEETVLKTNLEAAEVIAQQLRLRDLGGIIVIDFIDMEKAENREFVIDALKKAFLCDRAKVNIAPFTSMGLVQMTRKRLKRSLNQTLLQHCPYCRGGGLIKHARIAALKLLQDLKLFKNNPAISNIRITAHTSLAPYLSSGIGELQSLFQSEGKQLQITFDESIHIEQYVITKN